LVLAFFWSPNGRLIAYFKLAETVGMADNIALASPSHNGLPTNGHGPARSAETQPTRLDLALWVVDVESGRRQRLLTFQPPPLFVNQFMPFFDQYALSHRLWSPNSDALVLPLLAAETIQIVVVPLSGSQPQPIAQ